ncbi:alpha/beta hydrolase [Pseudonocardia sp. HH130630-07]|uniref:alpha/beta hydrolase n=1 Tax=Pseudonocardia sp. HH130630-07 TaxID=1690815 RepID=UPI0008151428|nr:alpha/beta hydrolase [Pseudonocardia sp. HH130630-07]ANY09383.1 hypothetical protein AFB00_27610 [Pseudonocardia sp. HH130630-07]
MTDPGRPPTYAAPDGPYPVGTREGGTVDTVRPVLRPADAAGRRLPVRVWYPAEPSGARSRDYAAGDETAVLRAALAATGAPADWAAWLAAVRTYGVEGAPPAPGRFPTVVFSHGALGWVTQNTPLMEHLAAHGHVVWSVGHPGEAGALRHLDGELVEHDAHFRETFVAMPGRPGYRDKLTGDVATRFAATPGFLDEHGMGPWARRWVDDLRAVIDALAADAIDGPAGEITAHGDLGRLGTLGMSFGAAAAASTAQQDERVRVAVNLDGGQWLSDLFDTDVRVPLLHLSSDLGAQFAAMGLPDVTAIDADEFFFEPRRTAGTRSDVHRICVAGVTHLELTDVVLLPPPDRARVLPGGGTVRSQRTVDLVNAFVRGHLGRVLGDPDPGFPGPQLARFPEARRVDLTAVRQSAPTQEGHR